MAMEAILACHRALSTKWLDLVAKLCEWWRMRRGPIIGTLETRWIPPAALSRTWLSFLWLAGCDHYVFKYIRESIVISTFSKLNILFSSGFFWKLFKTSSLISCYHLGESPRSKCYKEVLLTLFLPSQGIWSGMPRATRTGKTQRVACHSHKIFFTIFSRCQAPLLRLYFCIDNSGQTLFYSNGWQMIWKDLAA